MVEVDAYNPLIIAAITALSLVVGNLMTPLSNLIIEVRKSKIEGEKALRDKENRGIEIRNKAYLQFLSITEDQVTDTDEDMNQFFRLGEVEGIVALVFMHASPKISSIIQSAYPIEDWSALELVKKAIMKELILEKGEKYIVPLKGSIVSKSKAYARLDKDEVIDGPRRKAGGGSGNNGADQV